jgi:hypothetical protein
MIYIVYNEIILTLPQDAKLDENLNFSSAYGCEKFSYIGKIIFFLF